MKREVERYVNACPACNQAKPDCHKPYGELKPISAPELPLITVSIDFIVALPMLNAGNDALLTVTDKFSKYIKLISSKMTFTAKDWATRYFTYIFKDWESLQTIIFDHDPKFMSDF